MTHYFIILKKKITLNWLRMINEFGLQNKNISSNHIKITLLRKLHNPFVYVVEFRLIL